MIHIIRKMTVLCTSIVSQDVSIDAWPNEKTILWDQISGVNRTGATTTIEIGLKRGDEFYGFRAANAAAANQSVETYMGVHAPGDFRPTARFLVAAVGDMLELNCAGHIIDEA